MEGGKITNFDYSDSSKVYIKIKFRIKVIFKRYFLQKMTCCIDWRKEKIYNYIWKNSNDVSIQRQTDTKYSKLLPS